VIVEQFVQKGAQVCFTYRNSVEQAERLMKQYGKQILGIQADASDINQAFDALEMCVDSFQHVDVLVNNASSARDGSLLKLDIENFDYTLHNSLYPVFNYCKAVSPYMVNQKYGKIINIGSINGARGREGSLAYSTSKAGIEGFTRTIAKELGQYNICCNVVEPGFINTDGQKQTSELIKKLVLDECAIRRLTEPEEVANLVEFLASDKANNITGQIYRIDCGQFIGG
jgi:3-oxoacyl-[acyl-carrier protein] reductase